MLNDILGSSNPLIKYGGAAFIVFAPLYILQSYNVTFAWLVAIIILLMVVLPKVAAGASFA